MDINCKQTCGLCADENSEDGKEASDKSDEGDDSDDSTCPGGLIWCNVACKHEHMCKYD